MFKYRLFLVLCIAHIYVFHKEFVIYCHFACLQVQTNFQKDF